MTTDHKNVSGTSDWIQTYNGGQFWPLNPKPEDVRIEDIAQALSNLCRYAGHCTTFYSVAEHSCLLSNKLREDGYSVEIQKWALLHDAAEAYVVDMPRPIKREMKDYKAIEARVETAIALHFGLPLVIPDIVHEYDLRICNDERWQIMQPCVAEWGDMGKPLGIGLPLFQPREAKRYFMNIFNSLFNEETTA